MANISVTILNRNEREMTLRLSTCNIQVGQIAHTEDITLNKFMIQFSVYRDTKYHANCILKEEKDCDDKTSSYYLVTCTMTGSTIGLITKYNTYTGIFDVNTHKDNLFSVDIKATLFKVPLSNNSFITIYDDNTLLDFKISVKGSDQTSEVQSVGFHRVVLAAWSPVMMKMLSNSWKEKEEGVLALPVNLEVIEAFKKYVYMNELPIDKDTLLGLVELGNYFMDPKLEVAVTKAIAAITKAEDILDVFSYSLQYQLHNLTASMLLKIKQADIELLLKSLKKNKRHI